MSAARKLRRDPWLKGATVADLLIEQPTKFQLVIDGADSPSHRVDDPPIGSHRATSETAACGVVLPSERQKSTQACRLRSRMPSTASRRKRTLLNPDEPLGIDQIAALTVTGIQEFGDQGRSAGPMHRRNPHDGNAGSTRPPHARQTPCFGAPRRQRSRWRNTQARRA